jgi:capsular exopolysaccharide synthesis family protein
MPLVHITPGWAPDAVLRRATGAVEQNGAGDYGYGAAFVPEMEAGEGARSVPYWRALWKGKWWILLAALGCGAAAYGISSLLPKVYRASALVEIQALNDDFMNMRSVIPAPAGSASEPPEYNIRTQAAVLTSRPVLERTLDKRDNRRRLLAEVGRKGVWARAAEWLGVGRQGAPSEADLIEALNKALAVRTEANTRAVRLTFDSIDPVLAADFLNSLTETFSELTLERRFAASKSTSDWLVRQLQDVKQKLANSEAELQRFAAKANLTITAERENVDEENLRQIRQELSRAQADRIAKQAKFELASKAPVDTLPEVLDNQTLREYQVELTALKRRQAELASTLTADHPQMMKVQAQIAAMEAILAANREQILGRIGSEYESARRREALLEHDYEAQQRLLSSQAGRVSQYAMLKREVDTTRQLYDAMFQRVKEAGIASALRATDLSVIEPALAPVKPQRPYTVLNTALGLLLGLVVGGGVVAGRARNDQHIQGPGEITSQLHMPELGVIPSSKAGQPAARLFGRMGLLGGGQGEEERIELAMANDSRSPLAESIRVTLASILLSSTGRHPLRIIAFTSAAPGEGKTTVISNLAIALARINRKVLLVDGDLRKPRLHVVFGRDNESGLSDALRSGGEPAVQATGIENLFLMASGKEADDHLLFHRRLQPLLKALKQSYDMILIDTPPLLQMPDARLISRCADAAILVVSPGTSRPVVQAAQQRLTEDGSTVLGTILNNWRLSGEKDYYGRYAR